MRERAIGGMKAFIITSVNYLAEVFRLIKSIEGEIYCVVDLLDVVQNKRSKVRLIGLMFL